MIWRVFSVIRGNYFVIKILDLQFAWIILILINKCFV